MHNVDEGLDLGMEIRASKTSPEGDMTMTMTMKCFY